MNNSDKIRFNLKQLPKQNLQLFEFSMLLSELLIPQKSEKVNCIIDLPFPGSKHIIVVGAHNNSCRNVTLKRNFIWYAQ